MNHVMRDGCGDLEHVVCERKLEYDTHEMTQKRRKKGKSAIIEVSQKFLVFFYEGS